MVGIGGNTLEIVEDPPHDEKALKNGVTIQFWGSFHSHIVSIGTGRPRSRNFGGNAYAVVITGSLHPSTTTTHKHQLCYDLILRSASFSQRLVWLSGTHTKKKSDRDG